MKKLMSILLTLAMLATMMTPVLASGDFPGIGTPNVDPTFNAKISQVLGAIRWAGYAIAVGMLLYIGIKYVMSAANEKADVKKGLINYVIGVAILVAASTILSAIIAFMK